MVVKFIISTMDLTPIKKPWKLNIYDQKTNYRDTLFVAEDEFIKMYTIMIWNK